MQYDVCDGGGSKTTHRGRRIWGLPEKSLRVSLIPKERNSTQPAPRGMRDAIIDSTYSLLEMQCGQLVERRPQCDAPMELSNKLSLNCSLRNWLVIDQGMQSYPPKQNNPRPGGTYRRHDRRH